MKRIGRSPVRNRSAGLSLIELIIAMALSTVLILGLIEIFGSTRGAFASSQALARVQEGSRFSLEFLRRDLRMAGQLGCLNEFGHIEAPSRDRFFHHFIDPGTPVDDPAYFEAADYSMRIDLPLEIHEYEDTMPGEATAIAEGQPDLAASANSWTPPIPADLWAQIGGNAVAGSDVLVVRYAEEYPVTLRDYVATGTGLLAIEIGDEDRVQVNAPYLMSNCKESTLVQVLDHGGTTVDCQGPATCFEYGTTGGLNLSGWSNAEVYGSGTLMSRYRYAAYYVGRSALGSASLYKVGLDEEPDNPNEGVLLTPPEEVVEGVEMQQLQVGLVQAGPYVAGNSRIDSVTSYSAVGDLVAGFTTQQDLRARLQRIISVRVSLLMRSPEVGAGVPPVNPVMLVGDVAVTVPNDLRMRHVYDSTVTVRNRVRN